MRFKLGAYGELVPLAISGLTQPKRHDSLGFIEAFLHATREEPVACWIIGPGGYSYHLTKPRADGTQEIARHIQNFSGRKPREHIELKTLLEQSGKRHELHVVELSPKNLEFARTTMTQERKLDASNVSYRLGNIAETLPRGEPHVISCHNVLFYMSPQQANRTLEKLLRRLQPGGLLAISTNDEETIGRQTLEKTVGNRAEIKRRGNSVVISKKQPGNRKERAK